MSTLNTQNVLLNYVTVLFVPPIYSLCFYYSPFPCVFCGPLSVCLSLSVCVHVSVVGMALLSLSQASWLLISLHTCHPSTHQLSSISTLLFHQQPRFDSRSSFPHPSVFPCHNLHPPPTFTSRNHTMNPSLVHSIPESVSCVWVLPLFVTEQFGQHRPRGHGLHPPSSCQSNISAGIAQPNSPGSYGEPPDSVHSHHTVW